MAKIPAAANTNQQRNLLTMRNNSPFVLYYSETQGGFHIGTIDRHHKVPPHEHLRILAFGIEDRDANEFCNQMEKMYPSLDVMKDEKNNHPHPSYNTMLENFYIFCLGIGFDNNGMNIKI